MLEYSIEYLWKIVAHDDQGNSTEGPVWGFTTEEQSVGFICGDMLIDSRDGQSYGTKQIGEQCWMAENLAYLPTVDPSAEGSRTEAYYYVRDYQGTDIEEAKTTSNFKLTVYFTIDLPHLLHAPKVGA